MPSPPLQYAQYYLPPQHHLDPHHYHTQMSPQQHIDPSLHAAMQPSPPQLQIDPQLALYHTQYYTYSPQQQQQQPQQQQPPEPSPQQQPMHSQQLHIQSSPSSLDSDTMDSPANDGTPSTTFAEAPGNKRASSATAGGSGSKKKPRISEKDDAGVASPVTEQGPQGEVKVKATRGSRACTVCRRLKMKCVGAEQGPPCKRCIAGNHECIFEESNRGKRSSNNLRKHEQLTRSLRKMERTLDTVLRSINHPGLSSITSGVTSRSPSPSDQTNKTQALLASPTPPPGTATPAHPHSTGSPRLHSLPDNELNPLGLLAEASLANRRALHRVKSNSDAASKPMEGGRRLGVASDLYFKPGPMTILPLRRLYIERQIQPEMLTFTSTEEVVELFKIYFEHMNMHCGLLDPDFHTPSLVCSRSPFLLTTICAISSKFYTARPELHPRLTSLAKSLAFSVPEKGYKSVEIVQAYLLLTLWGCGPVERYEHDKTWLLLGMGIRIATDLNLHRKTAICGLDTAEGRARDKEVHNRERTWLMCYILDRSMSAQMGKPHSIKEDYIIQNATQWWQQSVAIPGDVGIVAYVELQRILSRSLDLLYSSTSSVSGLQTNIDYYLVIKTIESQLHGWHTEWLSRVSEPEATAFYAYRRVIGGFYYNYAMLVVNSFGLQDALERTPVNLAHFFSRCHTSAIKCATLVRDELGPRGYLRFSPDSHFVQCSYAVLSLLKLVRPAFRAFLDNEKSTFAIVRDVADSLERIAADPLHTPALYSTFLRALIVARVEGPTQPSSPPHNGLKAHAHHALNGDDVHGHSQYHSHADFGSPNLLGSGLDSSTPADFQFNGEMGPAVDISTFPPTMAPTHSSDHASGMLSMDSILSGGFWDSVLVPGYSNSLEGLSGGFVYGAGGSGLITPRLGTPLQSGTNTPSGTAGRQTTISETTINAAFDTNPDEGVKAGG